MFLSATEPLSSFRGRKVTVMGLGLFGGGKGLTEFLCRQGAEVTVTDKRAEAVLEPTVRELRHLPVRWVLGDHREADFTGADLVLPNPAVPRDAPLLRLCRDRGIPLETEMNLFFKYCRGRICAVTGSNGKTTTASLAGAMASRRWPGTRIGGNLGRSLLPDVESIGPEDWLVIETSSFQLEDLASIDRRPEISVVTNLSPNHLDRHGTYGAYAGAKKEILKRGPPPNTAVLNGEDPLVRGWAAGSRPVLYFGRTASVTPRAPGVWLDEAHGEVALARGGARTTLFAAEALRLPGRFNLLNAAAAAAAAVAMGVAPEEIAAAVRGFRAVEHRLEPVVEVDGVSYVNDSIATTPESTIAAIEALGPRVVIICGGSRKGCSFGALGRLLARRTRGAVLLGETAEAIRAAIPERAEAAIRMAADLEDAVAKARELARPGDRVILSPACPSYDMFVNFEERGRRFKEIARRLAAGRPI